MTKKLTKQVVQDCLDFLDAEADKWAAEVDLPQIVPPKCKRS